MYLKNIYPVPKSVHEIRQKSLYFEKAGWGNCEVEF